MARVTDPRLLEQLEQMQGFSFAPVDSRITDPQLVADLNSSLGLDKQPGRDLVEEAQVIDRAGNVPVTMLTGDPATDRRLAEAAASRGVRRELTHTDLAKVTGIAAGTGLSLAGGGLPLAVASGGLLSAGLEPSDDPAEIAKSGGKGMLIAYGLSKGLGMLGRRAAGNVAKAEAKAAEMAAKTVEKELATLRGAYGGARQNESRAIEVLLRAEATGTLTPSEAARLAALKASPEWAETIRNVARNYMDDFPELAKTATDAKAAFQTAAGSRAADVAEETQRVLSGAEAKSQLAARLKRYGPMGVGGAVAGQLVGGPLGALMGGAAGAAVRPMIHALRRAYQHPAVQRAIWDPVAKAFVPASTMPQQSLTPQAAALLNALMPRRSPVGLVPAVAEEQ